MKISHRWSPDINSTTVEFLIEVELADASELLTRLFDTPDPYTASRHECPTPTLDDHIRALINASASLTTEQRIRLHGIVKVCNDGKLP